MTTLQEWVDTYWDDFRYDTDVNYVNDILREMDGESFEEPFVHNIGLCEAMGYKVSTQRFTNVPITYVCCDEFGFPISYIARLNNGDDCHINVCIVDGVDLKLDDCVSVVASKINLDNVWIACEIECENTNIMLKMEVLESKEKRNNWGLFIGVGGRNLQKILYSSLDTTVNIYKMPMMYIEVEDDLNAYCKIYGENVENVSLNKVAWNLNQIAQENFIKLSIKLI